MPVLEDGLSSGHASDTDNNNPTVMLMKRQITEIEREINQGMKAKQENDLSPGKEGPLSLPLDINGCLSACDDLHMHSQIDSLGKCGEVEFLVELGTDLRGRSVEQVLLKNNKNPLFPVPLISSKECLSSVADPRQIDQLTKPVYQCKTGDLVELFVQSVGRCDDDQQPKAHRSLEALVGTIGI